MKVFRGADNAPLVIANVAVFEAFKPPPGVVEKEQEQGTYLIPVLVIRYRNVVADVFIRRRQKGKMEYFAGAREEI
ncbi:MAG: hypothetical protein K5657_04185 [Desulfovibrio sp.]|nr:hypothetical protein [Desulfovibrio sp.]